jgi:hypothetical protein
MCSAGSNMNCFTSSLPSYVDAASGIDSPGASNFEFNTSHYASGGNYKTAIPRKKKTKRNKAHRFLQSALLMACTPQAQFQVREEMLRFFVVQNRGRPDRRRRVQYRLSPERCKRNSPLRTICRQVSSTAPPPAVCPARGTHAPGAMSGQTKAASLRRPPELMTARL